MERKLREKKEKRAMKTQTRIEKTGIVKTKSRRLKMGNKMIKVKGMPAKKGAAKKMVV